MILFFLFATFVSQILSLLNWSCTFLFLSYFPALFFHIYVRISQIYVSVFFNVFLFMSANTFFLFPRVHYYSNYCLFYNGYLFLFHFCDLLKNFIWSYQIYFFNLFLFCSLYWMFLLNPFYHLFGLCLSIPGYLWIFQSEIITYCDCITCVTEQTLCVSGFHFPLLS